MIRKLLPLLLLILSGCTTTKSLSVREKAIQSPETPHKGQITTTQPADETTTLETGGILVVTDGPCCCIYTPWIEGWTECGGCIGYRHGKYHWVIVDTPITWQDNPQFQGPGVPYSDNSAAWMVDADKDGDLDLYDVAQYTLKYPYGINWADQPR